MPKQPTLGVHLLETITRGMYNNPLHCVREYIQNAYDSIREARRKGILRPEEGTVIITIDPVNYSLRIRDNGTGMEPEAAAVRLVDLGNSAKATSPADSKVNAGFRGIGRMAGMSYCKALIFDTSDGQGKKVEIKFDAKTINKLTVPGQEPTTIVEAIENNHTINESSCADGEHYLEVVLQGLQKDSLFLDIEKLGTYLAQVAPVDYDRRHWSFGQAIESIAAAAEQKDSLDHIDIQFQDLDGNEIRNIRRPLKDSVRCKKRQVRVDEIVTLPSVGEANSNWWGWYAKHEFVGQIDEPMFPAGLRIRMHNIEIGDERLVQELFPTRSRSTWCFGEIHITDNTITPNGQRDGFEQSDSWERIRKRIRDEARELERQFHRDSQARNTSASTLIKKSKKERNTTQEELTEGIESRERRDTMLSALSSHKDKLTQAIKQTRRPDDEKTVLRNELEEVQTSIKKIEDVTRFRTDDATAHLDKKTRRIVKKIFEVLRAELKDDQFFEIQEKINKAIQPGGKDNR